MNYFESSAISNSDMNNYLTSPELFLAVKTGKYRIVETQSMKSGSIKHKMILEGDKFSDEFYIQEETLSAKQREFIDKIIRFRKKVPFSTDEDYDNIHKKVYSISKKGDGASLVKKLWNRVTAEEQGKRSVTGGEWAEARKALDIVNDNPSAMSMLKVADMREKELYFKYKGLPCRAKIDGFGTLYSVTDEDDVGIIIDLKTHSRPLSKEEFIERAEKFGVKRQLAFYELALRNADGYKDIYRDLKKIKKIIISVDPVVARIYEVSEDSAIKELENIDNILDEIKLMLTADDWKKKSEKWELI